MNIWLISLIIPHVLSGQALWASAIFGNNHSFLCFIVQQVLSHIFIKLSLRQLKIVRKQRRTKEPLEESERGDWKSWLKIHSVSSLHGKDAETMKIVRDYYLSSKITADGDCSHKLKRNLLLGGKAMTTLDSILKKRDMTLPTRVYAVKVMVFPVCMDVRVGL